MTHLVFDFNPNGQPNGTSNFGSCYELAKTIKDFQTSAEHKLTTIAYVSNEVSQHTVLPVIACKQIAMPASDQKQASKARIGNILGGQDADLTDNMRLASTRRLPTRPMNGTTSSSA